MATKIKSTSATASGDTTKTLVGTITVPKDAQRISGVMSTHRGAATTTSGEAVTGLVELESTDFECVCQIPFDHGSGLITTSGGMGGDPMDVHPIPVDIPCGGGGDVSCYVTMDQAQTGVLKSRIALVFET